MRASIFLGIAFLLRGSLVMALHEFPTISDRQMEEAIVSLGQLVSIPSVSNPYSPDYQMGHLTRAAEWIENALSELGLKVSHPSIEGSAPYILAEYKTDASKPTVLLYAHYDVQPVDRDKWMTDPFTMVEKEGRLYGRGASDDKAGIIAILYALESCFASGKDLPFHIKILFEGEEEYSSLHLRALLEQYREALQADALIVLDGLNRDVHIGTLNSSTRGLVNIHLTVQALQKPIHSGIGCLAPDPAQALASLIYALKDPKAIPGFLDDCQPLNAEEKEILARSSQSPEEYVKDLGILPQGCLRGDPTASIYERIVTEPSISIVNMNCGRPNGGNSIQESASCTIGIRLTPGQNPNRIAENVMQYLRSQPVLFDLPIELVQEGKGAWAWKAGLSGPFSKKYFAALADNFPESSAMPIGGALPLLREFEEVFPHMEMIIPAVEDPQTSAHSHNESQDIALFRNAINTLIAFFYKP
jgi:cysteinylglycine-S-conjugate dipeptidase